MKQSKGRRTLRVHLRVVTPKTGQYALVGKHTHSRILRYFPHASFVVLDKAGHNLKIEQPELFNALVMEWLEQIP